VLQKGISVDLKDESDDEGQSDVSPVACWWFVPYVNAAFKWTYKNQFWVGPFMWFAKEEVLKWLWCWLHIHRPSHLGCSPTDSIHDEGMGSRDGNVPYYTQTIETDVLLQYDGIVSVGHSPSTATFDLVNCKCHWQDVVSLSDGFDRSGVCLNRQERLT